MDACKILLRWEKKYHDLRLRLHHHDADGDGEKRLQQKSLAGNKKKKICVVVVYWRLFVL